MFKQKNSCAVSTVMVAVAAIILAGCDASLERMGAALTSLFGSAYAAQREPVADAPFITHAIAIEHRHFAIYNAYRALFDHAPDLPGADASGAGDGADRAAAGDGRSADAAELCSTCVPLTDN